MSEQSLGAGARIEAARQQRGLALELLAAQLKVPVARLQALEREQWEQLPDPTHARALATQVCRVLGLDPAPVLAAMPRAGGPALERVSRGLNQPVRSGQSMSLPRWALLVLPLAAALAALLWWGPRSLSLPGEPAVAVTPASAPASLPALGVEPALELVADAPSAPASLASASPAPVSPAPVSPASAAALPASAPAAPQPGARPLLEIRATQGASWVSVVDARGASLASQLLNQGESLNLNPQALPVRMVLGNAPALQLQWRGSLQPLDAYAQRRVAKLELK